MKETNFLLAFIFLALSFSFIFAYDPSPLQDFCVAIKEPKDGVFVNGKFCKDPMQVKANDFFFSGLNIPKNTSNRLGLNITSVSVDNTPGLNTLGLFFARVDYAPNGEIPPHTHPRGAEIILVLEGTLFTGFVTSDPENRLISKTLKAGDVFVYPMGLTHFQINIGNTNAVAFAAFNSQNPGIHTLGNAVFGSKPPINPDVLTKAFRVDKKVVDYIQKQFRVNN